MGSCSMGASNIRLSYLDYSKARASFSVQRYGLKLGQSPKNFVGLVMQPSLKKARIACCVSSSEANSAAANAKNASKDSKFSDLTSQLIPNSWEVESLLKDICDTSIAEFELKLGGFRLHVTRNLTDKTKPPPQPPSPPPNPTPVGESKKTDPPPNGSISTTSLALSRAVPSSGSVERLIKRAADDGLFILKSPKVGYFESCRNIKGKKAPPSCKENQEVKEDQVLCYINAFGWQVPVKSDVSGEVIKILRKDGEPVGYGDPLILILPSFPGIKKLQ